jgi:hypothetical protein
MLQFLNRFHWSCLEDSRIKEHIRTAVDGPQDKDFAYSKPKRGEYAIGFNYTGGNFQWHYTWSICAFIALQMGKMKRATEYSPYIISDDDPFLISFEKRENVKTDPKEEVLETYVENSSGFIQPDLFFIAKEKEGTTEEFHVMTRDFYNALRRDLKRAEKVWSNLIQLYHIQENIDIRFGNIYASTHEIGFLEARAGLLGLAKTLEEMVERMNYKDLDLIGE